MNSVDLARFMHESYERHAKKNNWDTQKSCKVDFNDLPDENKVTMICVANDIIHKLVGESLKKEEIICPECKSNDVFHIDEKNISCNICLKRSRK